MKTRLVLLGGFLGAGKTTTMIRAAKEFMTRGHKVAIVTNDQGKELIDTELAKIDGLNAKEVTGGCFCCKFEDLYTEFHTLKEEVQPEIIIAEAVGSCTDLAATVIQPLKKFYSHEFEVSPLSIVVDPARLRNEIEDQGGIKFSSSVSYIFEKQLSEADIILLNKVDRYTQEEINNLSQYLKSRYPLAMVHTISAHLGDHFDELLDLWLTTTMAGDKILDIDYEEYAKGEAQLAWLNVFGDLKRKNGQVFDPRTWAEIFLGQLNEHFMREKIAIAHLKIYIGNDSGYVKASMVHTGDEPVYTVKEPELSSDYRVVINIRMESSPVLLDLAVKDALMAANGKAETNWQETYHECFSPLPPKPVYRLSGKHE
ncbi:GTP-binding protein [Staphylospora marina]|uniref:GTP-binding protein n=1 Tax=Staphylospora marina TaxID=2490858 RepID=UPI000F5BBF5C|nr:GTP-binding protein [Staphylospora marina]